MNADTYAIEHDIPRRSFPPLYGLYHPKQAPLERNREMADYGDALVAVWENGSGGTRHIIDQFVLRDKPVYIRRVR